MQPSVVLAVWLTLCALLSLHPSPAAAVVLPSRAPYPLPVTGGYKGVELYDANAIPALARIESPASLRGEMAWSSAPFTGPMLVNASCTAGSDCRVRYQIMLPNRTDSPAGCSLSSPRTSGGELIGASTMLLIERHGGCNFGDKAAAVEALGAGAIMHHGCDPAPPSSCDSGLEITLAARDIRIPATYMQYADAKRWRAYLTQRDDWLIAQAAASSSTAGIDLSSSSSSTGSAESFASSSSGMAGPGCPVCNCSAPAEPGGFDDLSEPLIVSFPATGPLREQERDVLYEIVSNMMQADPINGVVDSALAGTYTSLRGWSTIVSNRSADPCLDRVVGLWCVDGSVRHVWMFAFNGPSFSGSLDPLWGRLTSLVGLELSYNNFQDSVPESFCNLTNLQVLGLDREPLLAAESVVQRITALPDCLGTLPLVYISLSTNSLGTFPSSLSSARGLRVLSLDNNKLTRLPDNFSTQLSGLVQIDLSFNAQLNVSVPSFRGWSNLSSMLLNSCAFSGDLPPGAFDLMAALETIDLATNRITGPLPTFVGVHALREAALQENAFTGPIPESWSQLLNVTTLRLQRNQLSSPVSALGSLVLLQTLDLSYNNITTDARYGGDFGPFLGALLSASIKQLSLHHNALSGVWSAGFLTGTLNFARISLAHNFIQSLPLDLFTSGVVEWDLAYNNLTGQGMPPYNPLFSTSLDGPQSPLTSLKLQGNPGLSVWPLPWWLGFSSDVITAADTGFACVQISSPQINNFEFEVDPASRLYQGCTCVRRALGLSPLCQPARYKLGWAVRIAVFVVASVALIFVLVNAAAIIHHWDSPLYRASSRRFLMLVLAQLGVMSLGAMLYAAVPDVQLDDTDRVTPVYSSASSALCIGRAWATCLPLSGILGVILAKSKRVSGIFRTKTLVKAKGVTDRAIAKTVLSLMLLEAVFLLVFTMLPLSKPNLAQGGRDVDDALVEFCSFESGASIWLGLQLAFFGVLMVGAAWMAFRTRNLPSAFNESTSISASVCVLIFAGCVLVPLTLLVQDQPEAAMLLQGIGQAVVVMMLTGVLFGPKLYLAATTSHAKQKAMMRDQPNPNNAQADGPPAPAASTAPAGAGSATEDAMLTPNPMRAQLAAFTVAASFAGTAAPASPSAAGASRPPPSVSPRPVGANRSGGSLMSTSSLRARQAAGGAPAGRVVAANPSSSDTQSGSNRLQPLMEHDPAAAQPDAPARLTTPDPVAAVAAERGHAPILSAAGIRSDDVELASIQMGGSHSSEGAQSSAPPSTAGSDATATESADG